MSSATTSELPVLGPADVDDDDVVHLIHDEAPRNTPSLTVACCGWRAKPGDTVGDGLGGIDCPLCVLAYESGTCACYYYS